MTVGGGIIGVASPAGDIRDHVNASRPSRQEQGRPGRGGAGIRGEAHDLLPSPRMAQTQDVGTRAVGVALKQSIPMPICLDNVWQREYVPFY
jgi:hypothetical protein